MDIEAVTRSYKRWAPIYDLSFGAVSERARKFVVAEVAARGGEALEVGVGTGLSLPLYHGQARVTGIDYSADMLAKARSRVQAERLTHVVSLRRMDARSLGFADASFDTVVAMFLMSVVPDPEQVLSEMARVCRPGGEVLIANHFARDRGGLARVERAFARFENTLGWHSDFERDRVMGDPRLDLREERPLPPFGLFTFLRFRKRG
jgi:phosphatidylethanolamine/phosphatidyl-N-methylethanolamine N-methyltransferase